MQYVYIGAPVMLSPVGGVQLDPEDTATEMVCAELVSPQLVERNVDLTFIFIPTTAGE